MGILWIPGSSVLLILALGALTILYQWFSFALLNNVRLRDISKKQSFAAISKGRITGAIGAGLTFSLATIGLLFAFMRWPGWYNMLMPAVVPLIIIAVISIVKMSATKDSFYKKMLIRTLIFGAFSAAFLIAPYFWFDLKYRDFPEYRAAVKAANANPENKALQQKEQEEYKKVFFSEG